MDIRCRKTKCVHNKNFTCKSKDVTIGKSVECKCYMPDEKIKEDTSLNMFKKTPKVEKFRDVDKVNLTCHASCMFNKSKKCEANGITVNPVCDCPSCMTYLGKKNNNNCNKKT